MVAKGITIAELRRLRSMQMDRLLFIYPDIGQAIERTYLPVTIQ